MGPELWHGRYVVLAAAVALTAGGCGTGAGTTSGAEQAAPSAPAASTPPPTGDPPAAAGSASPQTTEVTPVRPVPTALEPLVTAAVGDLADRLGVAPADVRVVSAETVVWPDAGLGCPQPGMRYAQVTVDGARIQLAVGDRTYRYHSGGNRPEPFLCEQPRPTAKRSPDPRLTPRPTPRRYPGPTPGITPSLAPRQTPGQDQGTDPAT